MRAKRRMTLALFLALLLLLGCVPAFAEAPEEEELHFENTAKVLFYDERGGLPPRELVVEISGDTAGDAAPSPEDPRVFTGYTACRIAELVRELPKLYGMQFVPTDAWAEETQLPDADASLPCVGIREENVALAKKCAMMALKKPFELTDCSAWERAAPNGG